MKQESRGTKIFRCFEPSCQKLFKTPKNRRLHLIDYHGYPNTFFFSLPNQGLNDLYKRYGSGVSLVRPDWKPRPDSSLMIDSVSPNSVDSISSSSKHQSGEDIEDERESNHSGSELDMAIDHIKQLSLVPRQIQFGKKAGSKSFHR